MTNTRPQLSVVIPAYDEDQVLPELFARLEPVLSRLGVESEVLVVDDGSTDSTWPTIQAQADADRRYRGLRLSRNFGHQNALSAGLAAARGESVVTMDGDLQHPPELIPELLDKGMNGYDVVYAVRKPADAEGWFKVSSARFFYWLLNRLTGLDLPDGGADFRFMSRRVVDAIVAMPERHRFLRGMTRWIGYTQAVVGYERGLRPAGSSKYTVRRMLRFASDAIVAFSAFPLRIASIVGIVVSLIGAVYFVFVLLTYFLGDQTVAGWTSVIVAVLLLGGVQLACLGIIGQYLGRMYEEAKARPLYVVWEDTRAESAQEPAGGRRTAPLTEGLIDARTGTRHE